MHPLGADAVDKAEDNTLGRVIASARTTRRGRRLQFEQFVLELHGDKTRLLELGCNAAGRRQRRGLGKPETFTFLGFLFICGRSRRGRSFSTARPESTG